MENGQDLHISVPCRFVDLYTRNRRGGIPLLDQQFTHYSTTAFLSSSIPEAAPSTKRAREDNAGLENNYVKETLRLGY